MVKKFRRVWVLSPAITWGQCKADHLLDGEIKNM
jgi:hypothetical protein